MASRPLGLVPFAAQTETRGLESALSALGQSAVVISPSTWLNGNQSNRLPNPILIFIGERNYPSKIICSTLALNRNTAFAIFHRNAAAFDPEIAASCYDFICWPCADEELVVRIKRLTGPPALRPSAAHETVLQEEFANLNLLGRSPAFIAAMKHIKRFARCDAPVLIEGETGTGKEMAARAIHYLGTRRDRPFIPVNCGAIPDNLFENELFGHARGAFTDAKEAQPGLVALAEGGTLFLDEVDALSSKGQVALLRFLQDQQYRPLGGREVRHADIRFLAAANVDLATLATQGKFRQDLLFRLRVLSLQLPPLREREDDMVLLAEHFLQQCRQRHNQPQKHFAPEALRWLRSQAWPGNVRELESFIHREFLLTDGDAVQLYAEHIANHERRKNRPERRQALPPNAFGLKEYKTRVIAELERSYLLAVFTETGGNVSLAARRAGKERRAFGKLLKKYGIDKCRYPGIDK
jgi:DNA-binding NtrC family response regulator